jgi:hypothetical protein
MGDGSVPLVVRILDERHAGLDEAAPAVGIKAREHRVDRRLWMRCPLPADFPLGSGRT